VCSRVGHTPPHAGQRLSTQRLSTQRLSTQRLSTHPRLAPPNASVSVCLFTVGTVIDHIPQVDPEDAGLPPEQRPWRFAGQTTVCRTSTCNDHAAGDRPTYLQLWQSRNGEWASRASRPAALFNWQTQKRSLARPNHPKHPARHIFDAILAQARTGVRALRRWAISSRSSPTTSRIGAS
jgi:hypothetical protein